MKKMIFWIFLHVHEYFSIKFLKNFFFFQENIRKLLFFEVIETFYFVENCEKDDQNVYEITEMKVYSCENDLNMERDL